MLKMINQMAFVVLFFALTCYSNAIVCSVATCDSIATSYKERDRKESFTVVADVGQFDKSDLEDIPFGRKRCESYEERYFLVEKGTDIPNGLVSFIVEDSSATIEKLGIRESLQKKGHGTRLMHHVFGVLKKRGIKTVSLIPTGEAVSFYRKNGFAYGKMACLERNL